MSEIKTNAVEVIKKFKELSLKEMQKTMRSAVRAGASVLAKATKNSAKSSLPAVTKAGKTWGIPMIKAIRYGANKKGIGWVHIKGRKRDNGTFRLRFYEVGTVQRKTRKGYNRGQIHALHFFKSAQNSTDAQITEAMEKKIVDMIKKIKDANYD